MKKAISRVFHLRKCMASDACICIMTKWFGVEELLKDRIRNILPRWVRQFSYLAFSSASIPAPFILLYLNSAHINPRSFKKKRDVAAFHLVFQGKTCFFFWAEHNCFKFTSNSYFCRIYTVWKSEGYTHTIHTHTHGRWLCPWPLRFGWTVDHGGALSGCRQTRCGCLTPQT